MARIDVAQHSTTGVAPSELLMNRKLRTQLDAVLPDLEAKVMRRQQRMKEYYDRKSKARSINIGDPVFVTTHERTGPKYTPAAMHDRDGVVTVSEANDRRMIRRHMDYVRNRYPIVEDRVERPDMRKVDESGPMNDAEVWLEC